MTNPALQTRSQQTLANILDGAAALLEEKSFDEMTIQDIVDRAGCSVGAFYGRFKDKEALLHALDARFVDRQISAGRDWISAQESAPDGVSLRPLLDGLLAMTHQSLQHDLGLLRTLILRARLSPDPRFRQQEARLNEIVPAICEIILRHRAEIQHPDPETAVAIGFYQAYLTLRETVAWAHIGENLPLQGPELADELARAYFGYLISGAAE
jgi:AcrR family transcriptional regulator